MDAIVAAIARLVPQGDQPAAVVRLPRDLELNANIQAILAEVENEKPNLEKVEELHHEHTQRISRWKPIVEEVAHSISLWSKKNADVRDPEAS